MYDSTNQAAIPATAAIVACYMDGRYANEAQCRARFPRATVVTITVLGAAGARVADCETGDLTPASAAAWAHREIQAGRRPTVYCNLSTHPAVVRALAAYGLAFGNQVDWWGADYVGTPILLGGSVATQWIDAGGYDVSTTNGAWPLPALPVPPPSPPPIPAPTPPGAPTVYPEDNMIAIPDTLPFANGRGWVAVPAGYTAAQVVNVVIGEQAPSVVGQYAPIPMWDGDASQADSAGNVQNELEFGDGPFGHAPDGNYGVRIWVAGSAA